jgi:hypothetical protein
MEIDNIIKAIKGLEKGVNIKTGEKIFNEKENKILIDDLIKAKEILKKEKRRMERKKNRPKRAKERWTRKEEVMLLEEYNKLKSQKTENPKIINKLAIKHERTEGSIRSRLSRLV